MNVMRLLARGHDHAGLIACITGRTRASVEKSLARLRAAGLVSKRRDAESWYPRRPQQAHFSQEKTMAAATKRKAPTKTRQQTQSGTRTRQAGAGMTKKKTGKGTGKRGY